MAEPQASRQLLHLVFGGELTSLGGSEFRDLRHLDICPDCQSARAAWKVKAQGSVDNAHMRRFVAHLHRLLEPDAASVGEAGR